MKRTTIAVVVFVIAGCASPPRIETAGQRPTAKADDFAVDTRDARFRELALHALSHVGVPYRFGGSSPETGFDCSGFVQYVYRRGAGLLLPRNTEALSALGAPVTASELEAGDLVFFDTLSKPYSHVGIYLGGQRFIHAPATGGSVELVDMRSQYWRIRFSGGRRISL
jgi:cell wall-associated NlpC family hydrolase